MCVEDQEDNCLGSCQTSLITPEERFSEGKLVVVPWASPCKSVVTRSPDWPRRTDG